MREKIYLVFAVVGGLASKFFGGCDALLRSLLVLMACDYITGLIVAGVFHKSTKTETGTANSKECLKGICKKFAMLIMVGACFGLDNAMGVEYLRNACICALMANEGLSLLENAGLMGIPIPKKITQALEVLREAEQND